MADDGLSQERVEAFNRLVAGCADASVKARMTSTIASGGCSSARVSP